jgi:aspartate carbamoyltransferase catalytic subunit
MRHLLDLHRSSVEDVSEILGLAAKHKDLLLSSIKKTDILRGKSVVTLFYEPSTRTRMSFEDAGKILGGDVINVSSSGSSIEKGESLLNTGKTIEAMGVNAIVIRHPHSGAPYLLAKHLKNTSIINAGDGTHAHPTQALLDIFTVIEKMRTVQRKKLLIVGDILHSRVARSAISGFLKMGADVCLCGPETLLPQFLPWGNQQDAAGQLTVAPTLEEGLQNADIVMALRLQFERQRSGLIPSIREYIAKWQITMSNICLASPDVLIMHPGPLNDGIELSSEIATSRHSVIEEQVTNGVAIRMAILEILCNSQDGK